MRSDNERYRSASVGPWELPSWNFEDRKDEMKFTSKPIFPMKSAPIKRYAVKKYVQSLSTATSN